MTMKTSLLLTFLLAYGAQCNSDGIPVTIKDLKDIVIEDYHGAIDAKTLELFENVESLTLQHCNFSSFNENLLNPLKNLQKLVVSNNHFAKAKSDISDCCKKLKTVEVINSDFGPVSFEDMKKMAVISSVERLYLHRMDIPVLYSKSLVGSNMKTLEIEYSNLATVEDGALEGMDKLEVLHLNKNKLKTVPAMASLKNLKELNLGGNLLEKVTTADFPSLPLLEKVNIGHNPVKELDLKGLKEKLPNLKQFDISGIDIDVSKFEGINFVKRAIL